MPLPGPPAFCDGNGGDDQGDDRVSPGPAEQAVEHQSEQQHPGEEHSKVCLESATALAEPSSRPARRWAYDRNGMTSSDTAASTMPTVEGAASAAPKRLRSASTVT